MLFEPCGDLLKDYGAYCETLRVTEREEVYSAIHTRTVELPKFVVDSDGANTHNNNNASAQTDLEDGRDGAGGAAAAKAARKPSRAAPKDKASGRRKSSLKSAADAASAAAGVANSVSDLTAAASSGPREVTLTSISLHYPVFCLNQRDMTPLCRAIPHCPSLLSIELVGCGLSVQGYMKLVEAVYRSPRVVTVAVDFNVPFHELARHRRFLLSGRDVAEAGFVLDPTLHPLAVSLTGAHDFLTSPLMSPNDAAVHRASVSSAISQDRYFNASAATVPPQASTTAYPGTAVNAATSVFDAEQHRSSTSAKLSDSVSKVQAAASAAAVVSSRLSQISNVDAAGAAGVDAAARGILAEASESLAGATAEDESSNPVLYLYPTQYCGLDQQPTPLELQLQDEKEKKGKADGKKAQQLQAQRDLLRAFDQQHRIAVPKTWDGILFTGIHSLSLRGNRIDDATVGRLAQVLTDNPQSRLTSLNLWGNEITDAGAAALARMLRSNYVLKVLDVGNNLLGDAGLLELIRAFLMQQVTNPEEITAARRAYLTRRGASDEEQKAASQPLALAEIPSYEDLYAHWWYVQQQQQQQQQPQALVSPTGSVVNLVDTAGVCGTPRSPPQLPSSFPAPPARDAQPSPTAAGNPKRTPPVKSKTAKSESIISSSNGGAAAAATNLSLLSTSAARAANRHRLSFDRDCVRVRHIADNDAAIRIPGNTVLEVLNMEENRHVTVAGAREAARLLRLREPTDVMEMLAMVEVREQPGLASGLSTPRTSTAASPDGSGKRAAGGAHRSGASNAASSTGASANVSSSALPSMGTTVIHAPELHCAGLRLRVCGVRCHREANRAEWPEMDAAQDALDAALSMWAAAAPHQT